MPKAKKTPAQKATAVAPIKVEESNTSHMTPEELAIYRRVAADKGWDDVIGEESANDFSLMYNIFDLPPEAQKMEDERKYAFRWITRTDRRIDEVKNKPIIARWYLCNRNNTPFLKKYVDPIIGGIIREDQILVYRPWHLHELQQKHKNELADALDKSKSLEALQGKQGGGAEIHTSSRSLDGSATRMEVKGSDIIMADEANPDSRIYTGEHEMSDSDLIVND